MNALTPTSPDRAIEEINLAFQKMAQQEAVVEAAYVSSGIAIAKDIEILSGSQNDGEYFLALVKDLKDTASAIIVKAAVGETITYPSETRLRLIACVTDIVLAGEKATVEGNDVAAARAVVAEGIYEKVFGLRSENAQS